jgi:hypothetical protein
MITELAIIFWTFTITKALADSLQHDYPKWKSRFGIPGKWDWWFNPAISWENKNKGFWWGVFTPFSDAWHSLWTFWQIGFVIYAVAAKGWVSGLLVTGVAGVFILFNGVYAFARKQKYIKVKF